MSFSEDVKYYIRAACPIICVVAKEDWRAVKEIENVCENLKIKHHTWTLSGGLDYKLNNSDNAQRKLTDPIDFIKGVVGKTKDVYSIINFHFHWDTPEMIQYIKDAVQLCKATGQVLFFVSNVWKIPQELMSDIIRMDFTLPDKALLSERIDYILKQVEKEEDNPKGRERETILEAGLGMTTWEFENTLVLSILKNKKIDAKFIGEEKAKTVAKSGILEFYSADSTMKDVGGLGNLKNWLNLRKKIFSQEARDYGLKFPKGILLIGIPGTGKTLIGRTIASEWGIPLIKFDVGKLFAGLVGASEERTRTALELAEAVAPCVLFIDEIEKGMAGIGSSGNTDSGVTARVFGSILSWLNDKTRPVFVVATANNIAGLPPELLRAGRWDDIFFVDLPSQKEREDIFSIHIRKARRDPSKYNLEEISSHTEQFSGAEIASVVEKALIGAFSEDREMETEDIIKAAKNTVPLAITRKDDIEYLKEWAKGKAIFASSNEPKNNLEEKEITRKIRF